MGILKNGPFGGITGTTGGLTTYWLNGQNVTRSKSHNRNHQSVKQLANCQQIKVLNEFFTDLCPLLKVGFSAEAADTTKNYHNIATAYNKKNAIKGEYPNLEMDYPKVLISRGNLMPAVDVTVEVVPEGLKFSWYTDGWAGNYGRDQVMMMAFDPETKQTTYVAYGAYRSQGHDTLLLPNDMMNRPLETYISFVSIDRLDVATSVYAGLIG